MTVDGEDGGATIRYWRDPTVFCTENYFDSNFFGTDFFEPRYILSTDYLELRYVWNQKKSNFNFLLVSCI